MDRIFSLLLAILEISAVWWTWGTAPSIMLLLAMFIPLAGIWFGSAISQRLKLEGLSFGEDKTTQTESSSTSIVQFIGWTVLGVYLVGGVIAIWWFWLPLAAFLITGGAVYIARRRAANS